MTYVWTLTALSLQLLLSVLGDFPPQHCSVGTSGLKLRSRLNQSAHWLGDLEFRTTGTLEDHMKPVVVDLTQERKKCGDMHAVIMKVTFEGSPPSLSKPESHTELFSSESSTQCPPPPPCPPSPPRPHPVHCPPPPPLPPPLECPDPLPPRECPKAKRPLADGFQYYPGLGYYKVHRDQLIWTEAKVICESEGGHLGIIDSVIERVIFVSLARGSVYIGMHDRDLEGHFVTVLGLPSYQLRFLEWASKQPDNYEGIEDCVAMISDGKLNDVPCHLKLPFICEVEIN